MEPHIAVGIVQARGHEIAYLQDAYYLERALAPISGGTWAIRPKSLTPAQLPTEPLSEYSALFCVNLPALDRAAAKRLHAYVVRGGHVVWTCGKRIDPDQYETMNAQVDGQLLPTRLTAVRAPSPERPDGWRLGWLDDQHPALSPLIEPASLLQSVLVHKYMRTAPAEGSDVRVLARLDDGAPLLVERAVGAGSVLLLATSVNVDWTNLPLRPLFLPLVTRLTFHLADSHTVRTQRVAGTPLIVPLAGARASAVEVVQPSGVTVRLTATADRPQNGRPTVRYTDTHAVGVYEVKSVGGKQRRQTAFAFNLDPGELNAAVLDRKDLAARLGREKLLFCGGPNDLARVMDQLRAGESLGEAFLVVVLIALVAEAFVGNRRAAGDVPERPPRSAGRRRRQLRQQPDVIVIR
jgi:hypothetical protein